MIVLMWLILAVTPAHSSVTPAMAHPPLVTGTQGYRLRHPFRLEIDGVAVNGVNTIEGLDKYLVVKNGVVYRQKVPGNSKWAPVTLRRGMTSDNTIFEWRAEVVNGAIEKARRTCTIDTTTPQGQPLHIILEHCWPSKYEGPLLNGRNSAHASETVEISYETLELK